ncbi:MAG: hypothetical protein ACM3XO_22205 [Bacteroidota bacterium]
MSKKHRKVNETIKKQADDFKLIHGITQGIENRLYAAGIQTYTQLASLTAQEIILKLGKGKRYSPRQIEEQNWIGQAQRLIPNLVQNKSDKKEITKPAIRQHYENFTIELLLDQKNLARRTHIVHVQSGDADTWAGWKTEQFLDFVVRHTGIRLSNTKPTSTRSLKSSVPPAASTLIEQTPPHVSLETVPAVTAKMSHKPLDILPLSPGLLPNRQPTASTDDVSFEDPPNQPPVTPEITDPIVLREWKITLPDTDQALHSLPQDQSFNVSLTLDLSKLSFSTTPKLACTATIHAKRLGGSSKQMIGQVQEIFPFNPVLLLTISCTTLSAGIYRLEGLVTLRIAEMQMDRQPKLMSFFECGPIRVY